MKQEIFDGKYVIFDNGDIWSNLSKKFIKPLLTKKGYYKVNINNKQYYIHRLVAQSFIDNPNNLPIINHINENKIDNRIENLEWCDSRYNINYYYKSKYPNCYLTKHGSYQVTIFHNKKVIKLGTYKTIEQAYNVVLSYKKKNNI